MKKWYIASFAISLVALIIGASFHGYRMHPEQVEKYELGVNMGISMITVFALFLLIGIILIVIDKKKNRRLSRGRA